MPFNASEEEGWSSYIGYKEHHVPLPTTHKCPKITHPRMSNDSAISPILEKRNSQRESEKEYNRIIYHVKLWVVKSFKESCWENCLLECMRNDCRAAP